MIVGRIPSIYRCRGISKKPTGRLLGGSAVSIALILAAFATPRSATQGDDVVVSFCALGDQLRLMNVASRIIDVTSRSFAFSDSAVGIADLFGIRSACYFKNFGAESLGESLARLRSSDKVYKRAIVPSPFATQAIDLSYALTNAENVIAVEPQPSVDFTRGIDRVKRIAPVRHSWLDLYEQFFQACYPDTTFSAAPRVTPDLRHTGGSEIAVVHVLASAKDRTVPSYLARDILANIKTLGLRPVLLGAAHQNDLLSDLASEVDAVIMTGKRLIEVARLMSTAAIFVGIDSSMMHLADAVGLPSVVLYGTTRPAVTGPFYTRHIAVLPKHPGFTMQVDTAVSDALDNCIESIDIEDVRRAIAQLLAGNGRVSSTSSVPSR